MEKNKNKQGAYATDPTIQRSDIKLKQKLLSPNSFTAPSKQGSRSQTTHQRCNKHRGNSVPMDASRSIRTLNVTNPLPLNFRSRASFLRPFCLSQFKKHFNSSLPLFQRYSPICSQCNTIFRNMYLMFFFIMFRGCLLFSYVGEAERGNGDSLPNGVGKGVNEVSRNKKLLQVVLVSPQVLSII